MLRAALASYPGRIRGVRTEPDRIVVCAGLTTVPVPVDDEGLCVDRLRARRTWLVRWAAEAGATIWEDDYDGELRYDRQLLIGYGTPPQHGYVEALDVLAATLATVVGGS